MRVGEFVGEPIVTDIARDYIEFEDGETRFRMTLRQLGQNDGRQGAAVGTFPVKLTFHLFVVPQIKITFRIINLYPGCYIVPKLLKTWMHTSEENIIVLQRVCKCPY